MQTQLAIHDGERSRRRQFTPRRGNSRRSQTPFLRSLSRGARFPERRISSFAECEKYRNCRPAGAAITSNGDFAVYRQGARSGALCFLFI
ncbi:MAG: hypothetical protein J6P88_01360, partial [Clostridia bacterium]|nr:hypothetical protein [Clostridia bacterium]